MYTSMYTIHGIDEEIETALGFKFFYYIIIFHRSELKLKM